MKEDIEQQQFFMRKALLLGRQGRITAPPNPWAGSVVVNQGKIVGGGYHVEPGKPHAEIIALQQAGEKAKGGTIYVTLEPCAHHGKTPPCMHAIVESGIKKVVIPLLDPDRQVAGKGVNFLKEHGIEVVVGICHEEAEKELAPYLFHRRQGRPYTVLKAAISCDGRIAARDGSSQWITGEKARQNAHLLRAESQAVLVGTQTAIQDMPRLDVRHVKSERQPLRVVLDRQGKVPLEFFRENTLVYTTESCRHIKEWESRGAIVEIVPEIEGTLSLSSILENLGKKGVIQLLVEGGSGLQGSFIEQKLAEKIVLYVGNCLLGNQGKALFNWEGPSTIALAERFTLEQVTQFDNDVRLDYCRPLA